VARDRVDALAEQLAYDERFVAILDERRERAGCRLDEQIVNAARVARRREAEPARRIARQHVALENAARDETAFARRDAFGVERRARERARNPRILVDVDERRQDLLADRIEQERRA